MYLVLKDLQTGVQTVVSLLAIVDLFAALAYAVGSENFLGGFDSENLARCTVFTCICEYRASSSFGPSWTTILAFYFNSALVYKNGNKAPKLLPFFNVIAWFGIVGPFLILGKLGYTQYIATNWCYTKDLDETHLTKKSMIMV